MHGAFAGRSLAETTAVDATTITNNSSSIATEHTGIVAESSVPPSPSYDYRAILMGGYGNGSSWSIGTGLGISWAPIQRWPGPGIITPGIEITSTYWSGRQGRYKIDRLRDTGVTFLLRLESYEQYKGLFLEGGIGLHQLSETRFYSKKLGRHSQIGSNIAMGYYIPRTPLELSVRVRHLSNAGTKSDNSGLNQMIVRLAARF